MAVQTRPVNHGTTVFRAYQALEARAGVCYVAGPLVAPVTGWFVLER